MDGALSNHILELDRKQSIYSPDRKLCPRQPEHGGMGVHASGAVLVCGKCGYNEPTSLGVVEDDELQASER